MTTERLIYLLGQKHTGSITDEENIELENWYQQQQDDNFVLYDGGDRAKEEQVKQDLTNQLMNRIDAEEYRVFRINRKRQMQRWSAVAAVLISLLTIVAYYALQKETTAIVAATIPEKSTITSTIIQLKNTTPAKQSFKLNDGSRVTLSPESHITYDSSFTNKKREIRLQGEGFFDVSTNPQMPFSVEANGITVTALGTSFTVTSYAKDSMMNVKLHDGKVVIQADQASLKRKMNPVYLQPGEQLSIHPVTLASSFKPLQPQKEKSIAATVKPTIPKNITSLQFDREPLDKVLQRLADHYHILITYDEQDIRDLDFSGTVRLPSQITPVLQRIAILNGLTVTATRKGYHIGKN